jgi:hypothetical protein
MSEMIGKTSPIERLPAAKRSARRAVELFAD